MFSLILFDVLMHTLRKVNAVKKESENFLEDLRLTSYELEG